METSRGHIKHSWPYYVANFVIYMIMIFVVVMCFFPFIYMLALSLSSPQAIINNQVSLFPIGINLKSYEKILTYPNFFNAYKNTITYTVFGTLIALCMNLLFAYPLSKSHLKGRNLVMKLVVFSMFFSGGLIPNFLLISTLRLTNTIWAMLLPFGINQFNLILMINFLKDLPEEIEEAATIDGLGYFRILIQIIFPLSLPAIATIALYTAVFFWNDWFFGLIYLNSKLYPVMLFLRNIVQGTATVGDASGAAEKSTIEISIKSAAIIITTLPIILFYPFLQRFFVKGLTVGSVKG